MAHLRRTMPKWELFEASVPPPLALPADAVNTVNQQHLAMERLRTAAKDGHRVGKEMKAISEEIQAQDPYEDARLQLEQEIIRLEGELATAGQRDDGLDLDELTSRPTRAFHDTVEAALRDSDAAVQRLQIDLTNRPTAQELHQAQQELHQAQQELHQVQRDLAMAQNELVGRPTTDSLLQVQRDLIKARKDLEQAGNERDYAQRQLGERPTTDAHDDVQQKLQQAEDDNRRLSRRPTEQAYKIFQDRNTAIAATLREVEEDRDGFKARFEAEVEEKGFWKDKYDKANQIPSTQSAQLPNYEREQFQKEIARLEAKVERRDAGMKSASTQLEQQIARTDKLSGQNDELDAQMVGLRNDLIRVRKEAADRDAASKAEFKKQLATANGANDAAKAETADVQKQLELANDQIQSLSTDLQKQLQNPNNTVVSLNRNIARKDDSYAPLTPQFEALQEEKKTLDGEVANQKTEINQLRLANREVEARLTESQQSVQQLTFIRAEVFKVMYKFLRIGPEDITEDYFLADEDIRASTTERIDHCTNLHVQLEAEIMNMTHSLSRATERITSMVGYLNKAITKCNGHEKLAADRLKTLIKLKGITDAVHADRDRLVGMYEEARDKYREVAEYMEAQGRE